MRTFKTNVKKKKKMKRKMRNVKNCIKYLRRNIRYDKNKRM